jgi:hypothetical protein
MSQAQAQRTQRTVGILQIAIIVLIVITALVHLQRGMGMSLGGFGGRPPAGPPGGFNMFQYLPLPLATLFLLNGIGYLILGTALYLPALSRFRPLVRRLLIAFAAVTFVLYFLFNGFRLNPIAVVDKVAELTLIVLLFVDGRREQSAVPAEAAPA